MRRECGNDRSQLLAAVVGSAEPALVVGQGGLLTYGNDAAVQTLGYEAFEELVGRPSHDTVHYKRLDGTPIPVAECAIQAPLRSGRAVRHDDDWFVRRDGRMLPVSYRSVPVRLPAERGMLVTFADAAELRRRRRELRQVAAVLTTIEQPVYVADGDGIARFANPAALRVLGYRDVAELEGRDGHLLLHHKQPDGSPYRRGACPVTRCLRRGEPVAVEEDWWVRADGSTVALTYSASPIALPGGRGVVVVFTQLSRDHAIARRAATRAGGRAARRRILEAADDARRELAHDLHDGAQQRFIAAITTLRRARQACAGGAREATELVDLALDQTTGGIDELRELAAGLHPPILVHRGLGAAVEALADRQPLPVRVCDGSPGRLPGPIESGAYFLVSEALTNVVKHAEACCAEVGLACDGTALAIEIRDDGMGGMTSKREVPASLADRVAALDGTLDVTSPPGHGTTLRAVIPIW